MFPISLSGELTNLFWPAKVVLFDISAGAVKAENRSQIADGTNPLNCPQYFQLFQNIFRRV